MVHWLIRAHKMLTICSTHMGATKIENFHYCAICAIELKTQKSVFEWSQKLRKTHLQAKNWSVDAPITFKSDSARMLAVNHFWEKILKNFRKFLKISVFSPKIRKFSKIFSRKVAKPKVVQKRL